jgi:Tfp pilus assembly protein PilF
MIEFQLAEMYRTAGNKQKAIERYKAAVQKDPKNNRVRMRLKELESKP